MWWSHGDWGWGAWLVMALGMVAFWALVIWLFVNIIRTSQTVTPSARTPEEILAERLARGAIDDDEYRGRLHTLHASEGDAAKPKASAR